MDVGSSERSEGSSDGEVAEGTWYAEQTNVHDVDGSENGEWDSEWDLLRTEVAVAGLENIYIT